MPNHVTQVNPKTSERKALAFEYVVERPETAYASAVAEALVNARAVELTAALKSMMAAGFDPVAIHLATPNGVLWSGGNVNILHWALYHSDRPRRMFRAVVEAGVDATSILNGSIVRDKGPTTVERWAWKLILSHATEEQRLGAYPLESTGLSPSPDVQAILNPREPGQVGSAIHQAVISGQTGLLPDLLAALGLPQKERVPKGSFSVSRAILWRTGTQSSRFDWHEFLQAVDDDTLLELVSIPTVTPDHHQTLLEFAIALAQKPAQLPGVDPLAILLNRLGSRLAPALLHIKYVRTASMSSPVFDRVDQCIYHHTIVEPRVKRSSALDETRATVRAPRVRP